MSVHAVDVLKVTADGAGTATDLAAAEEPLEIRLHGEPFVTIMRTPGADRELTAGFLLSEGVISGPDDLGAVRHCTEGDAAELQNVVNVTLAGDAAARAPDLIAGRRAVTANSSCGVCGRRAIADLLSTSRRVHADWRVGRELVESLPGRLRQVQAVFEDTGGLHAAALFEASGTLVASAEDVGRHNAVDKVIGRQLLLEQLPLDRAILFVSGRTSFEIVQKALAAGIPILAAVSAPSSLAVALARESGMTLLGFVRSGTFNVYAGAERVDLGPAGEAAGREAASYPT